MSNKGSDGVEIKDYIMSQFVIKGWLINSAQFWKYKQKFKKISKNLLWGLTLAPLEHWKICPIRILIIMKLKENSNIFINLGSRHCQMSFRGQKNWISKNFAKLKFFYIRAFSLTLKKLSSNFEVTPGQKLTHVVDFYFYLVPAVNVHI